jgi:hypothetical protein
VVERENRIRDHPFSSMLHAPLLAQTLTLLNDAFRVEA